MLKQFWSRLCWCQHPFLHTNWWSFWLFWLFRSCWKTVWHRLLLKRSLWLSQESFCQNWQTNDRILIRWIRLVDLHRVHATELRFFPFSSCLLDMNRSWPMRNQWTRQSTWQKRDSWQLAESTRDLSWHPQEGTALSDWNHQCQQQQCCDV